MKKPSYRVVMGLVLFISGLWALGADLIYGSKAQAEEYLFGLFMISISELTLTVFTIMFLLFIVLKAVFDIDPKALDKLLTKGTTKRKKK